MIDIKALIKCEKVLDQLDGNLRHLNLLAYSQLGYKALGLESQAELVLINEYLNTHANSPIADFEYAEQYYNTLLFEDWLFSGLTADQENKFHSLYGNRLFGSSQLGEHRGAKHKTCSPGNRLCGTRCIREGDKCRYDTIYKTVEAQKFAIRDSISAGVLMPKELRNKLVTNYPNIFENPKFERFFWHQMYSSNTTEDQSVVVPQDVLKEFAGAEYADLNKFLEDFQAAAGGPEHFEVKAHSYAWKRAREVKLHMKPSLRRLLKDDLKKPNFVKLDRRGENKQLVFALGGFDHSPELQSRIRTIQKSAAIEVANSLPNQDQKRIALYHANQTQEELPKFHWEEAYAAATAINDKDSQLTALRILNNIESNPIGYYRPSKITTRLFVANHLQGLKSSVRAQLIPEMVEVDLVSSFAHVLASVTDNQELQDVLREAETNPKYKGKIWGIYQEDLERAGFDWDDNIKKLVKTQHCALGYGGEKGGCTLRINEFAKENPKYNYLYGNKEFRNALYNSRAFKAIDLAGTAYRTKIIKDGFATNAYGRKFPVEDKSMSRSVMSAIMHSYETALVANCGYAIPKQEAKFNIVYFGHDGFGVVPKQGASIDDIQKQINGTAKKFRETLSPPIKTATFEVKPGKLVAEDEDIDFQELERVLAKFVKVTKKDTI